MASWTSWSLSFGFSPRLPPARGSAGSKQGRFGASAPSCASRLPSLRTPLQDANCLCSVSKIENFWFGGGTLIKRSSFHKIIKEVHTLSLLFSFPSSDGEETMKPIADGYELYQKPCRNLRWSDVLVAANVMIYVAQIATRGKLMLWGAKINSLIDGGQVWRLATSPFLHANILHLLVNCMSLSSIGPAVEQLSGRTRFLAIYFTSALASTYMSYRFCQSPAVGASGAIFGLAGSYAIFWWRHRTLLAKGRKKIQHIASVIVLNMAIGLSFRRIDNWGHLGGLLAGMATSWFLGPCWQYQYHPNDGKVVLADRAPIRWMLKQT